MTELQGLDISGLDLEQTFDDSMSSVMSSLSDFGKGPVHHPPCPRHADHLIYIKDRPYCLGCACAYAGIGIGGPLFFFFTFFLEMEVVIFAISAFVISLIPSLLQIKIQRRTFKIVSRILLGVGIVFWFGPILLLLPWNMNGLVFRIGGILFYIVVAVIVNALRLRSSRGTHCERCPEGEFPICTYRLPMIEEMISDLEKKGEQDKNAYGFLVSSRRQIMEKDGSAKVRWVE